MRMLLLLTEIPSLALALSCVCKKGLGVKCAAAMKDQSGFEGGFCLEKKSFVQDRGVIGCRCMDNA